MTERKLGSFPWAVFLTTFPMLFYIYNSLDAPSHPYEAQSASDIAQKVQSGDSVARVLIIALGIIGASLLIRYRNRINIEPAIATILFSFITWNFVTAFWSVDTSLSIRRLLALIFMVTFYAGCAVRMSAVSLARFAASIPALSIIPGVLSEIRYDTFKPFSNGYRFGGTAPHPNVQAASLSVATLLLSWLCWSTHGRTRIISLIVAPVAVIFLFLTGSRTSLAAVIVSLVFSATLYLIRDHKRFIPLVLTSVCLLAALAALGDLAIGASPQNSVFISAMKHSDEGAATTLNGRMDLWSTLFTYAAKRPWSGYGYGAFWSPQRIEAISADQGWAIQQSHSGYIEELISLGYPGALLYIVLLFASLACCTINFTRHRDIHGAFASVLLFIAIHDSTEAIDVGPSFSNTVFYMIIFWIALRQVQPGIAPARGTPERL